MVGNSANLADTASAVPFRVGGTDQVYVRKLRMDTTGRSRNCGLPSVAAGKETAAAVKFIRLSQSVFSDLSFGNPIWMSFVATMID